MAISAIVRDQGRQIKVTEGEVIEINRLGGKVGSEITLNEVLFIENGSDIQIGQPLVKDAKVECEILNHTRGEKIDIFKIKRRKNYRRKTGHRQDLTQLKVKNVSLK